MNREEECVCCHEIEQVATKNQEVMEYTKPTLSYDCITDNPGFHTVCLDRWVLQAAWLDFKQQYGSTAYGAIVKYLSIFSKERDIAVMT